VENLCLHKMGGRLYERLRQRMAFHVGRAVDGLAAASQEYSQGALSGGGGAGSLGLSAGGGTILGGVSVGRGSAAGAETFLVRVEAMWGAHCGVAATVRSVFLVLDRTFVVPTPGLRPIVDLCHDLLRCHLTDRPQVPHHKQHTTKQGNSANKCFVVNHTATLADAAFGGATSQREK
jgi:hypothetical protein